MERIGADTKISTHENVYLPNSAPNPAGDRIRGLTSEPIWVRVTTELDRYLRQCLGTDSLHLSNKKSKGALLSLFLDVGLVLMGRTVRNKADNLSSHSLSPHLTVEPPLT